MENGGISQLRRLLGPYFSWLAILYIVIISCNAIIILCNAIIVLAIII